LNQNPFFEVASNFPADNVSLEVKRAKT